MRIVCQQPHYLPWIGYFELFAHAEKFVFLDSVQWIRQGRQHRTKIPSPHGPSRWLTVPIQGHGHREKRLKDILACGHLPWAERHWRLVKETYGRAPRFADQLEPLLRPFFERARKKKFLAEICEEGLWLFWEKLGLQTELHWASDLPGSGGAPGVAPGKNERLISLCRELGATEYYSTLGSTRYLDLSAFRAAGIRVRWQHFASRFPGEPTRQLDLSILDWVAHHDFSVLREAIGPRSGSRSGPPAPRAYTE
jgi:hypothetical protein